MDPLGTLLAHLGTIQDHLGTLQDLLVNRLRIELGMLELVAKSLTQDDPMDSIQVGKAVFVKESYTTLGIEEKIFSPFPQWRQEINATLAALDPPASGE